MSVLLYYELPAKVVCAFGVGELADDLAVIEELCKGQVTPELVKFSLQRFPCGCTITGAAVNSEHFETYVYDVDIRILH